MKEVVITSKVVGRGGGSTPVRAGQGSQVDLSDYLLKAIWDEAWELRTDSNGQDYIFGKLPIVTQYGITMYAGDSVDVGTIYDGLPIDGSTIYWENGVLKAKGGTEGDITSITSAMIISALGYTPYDASNPSGYITSSALSGYATQSWVQSLGYATTSDLDSRINALINGAPSAYDTLKEIADILAGNVDSIGDIITTLGTKADKNVTISAGTGLTGGGTLAANRTLSLATSGVTAGTYKSVTVDAYGRVTGGSNPTTLAGYGITDAYTKNEITSLLGNYVTLASEQTITGKKNFTTGGLFVNGSQITYDSTNKYWKLEGDLLVTGGVTMYGNDSEFVPSTIMDAILYDDTTLGINSSGELYVKGSVGGSSTLGGLSNVGSWADSVADVDRIMYQASGSSMWVAKSLSSIGLNTTELQNYLTSNNYINSSNIGSQSVNYSNNSGLLSGYKESEFYSTRNRFAGFSAYGQTGTPYYCVSLTEIPHSSNCSLTFMVTRTHNEGNQKGILNCSFRYENGIFSVFDFSLLASSMLTAHDIKLTTHIANGKGCFKIYVTTNSWRSFEFNLINESAWGAPVNFTTLYSAQKSSLTAIPSTETIYGSPSISSLDNNSTSATKLATARTIWGQSFDGTGNVSGSLSNVNSLLFNSGLGFYQGDFYSSSLTTNDGVINVNNLIFNGSGNVGVRTLRPAYNVDVNGTLNATTIYQNGNAVWHSGNLTPSNYLLASSYTAADVLAKLKTVDGSGSGLDADLLDGQQSDWYQNNAIAFSDCAPVAYNNVDANVGTSGMLFNYGSYSYWKNAPIDMCYGQILTLRNYKYGTFLAGQLAWDIIHSSTTDTTRYLWWRATDQGDWIEAKWHQIAFTDSNVASATKLQDNTSFTAWGQTFFTNGKPQNISGSLSSVNSLLFNSGLGFYQGDFYSSSLTTNDGVINVNNLIFNGSGNVGVRTLRPAYNVDVNGTARFGSLTPAEGTSLIPFAVANAGVYGWCASFGTEKGGVLLGYNNSVGIAVIGASKSENISMCPDGGYVGIGTKTPTCALAVSGDILSTGGITMYSDKRKKTILNHVELSLKQIAEAPLIEHYYNCDENRTTHVGSIAQYWASMNDWFCKLDSEGYYTMEIQNAALASAISIARELDRYETKTDEAIEKLKKRICELEEEVERLKSV